MYTNEGASYTFTAEMFKCHFAETAASRANADGFVVYVQDRSAPFTLDVNGPNTRHGKGTV